MSKPTAGQIAKLPAWARDYIRTIERQRDAAARTMHGMIDSQTPSCFSSTELLCVGEERTFTKRYFQTYKMEVLHRGVLLSVTCLDGEDMRLQWGTPEYLCDQVAFVPGSFQQAHIVAKENMR